MMVLCYLINCSKRNNEYDKQRNQVIKSLSQMCMDDMELFIAIMSLPFLRPGFVLEGIL